VREAAVGVQESDKEVEGSRRAAVERHQEAESCQVVRLVALDSSQLISVLFCFPFSCHLKLQTPVVPPQVQTSNCHFSSNYPIKAKIFLFNLFY
jgi:hypothetical protein